MTSATVLLPTGGAVPAARPGVRENRGAGPGSTLPSTEANVERAARWGCDGASCQVRTGAAQASVPSNTASHSARVRLAKAAAKDSRIRGQALGSCCEPIHSGTPSRVTSRSKNCGSSAPTENQPPSAVS